MSFRLCNAPVSFQRCMMSIFSNMIEEIMEVFMDDFSIYKKTFDDCLKNLDKILQRCEEKNLVLNWENIISWLECLDTWCLKEGLR
jgi:hypothetical protein